MKTIVFTAGYDTSSQDLDEKGEENNCTSISCMQHKQQEQIVEKISAAEFVPVDIDLASTGRCYRIDCRNRR